MDYIRQITYEMKTQRMMTWVSVGGTALSIFLVMAFFMADQVRIVGVSPESDRDRILTGENISVRIVNGKDSTSSSGAASYETCRKLYGGLDGIEKISYMSAWPETYNAGLPGRKSVPVSVRHTDEAFWSLYELRFLYGQPYDEASCESGERIVVISRSLARSLFQEEDVVGRDILLQHVPYRVIGVIEDVSPMMRTTGTDLFLPLGPKERTETGYNGFMGNVQAQLLPVAGVDEESIKRQVESRYATINSTLGKEGKRFIYHGQPYNAEIVASESYGSNTTPDLSDKRAGRYMVYIVMTLLPAINLGSMTRSRLRHRVSEIGVRRAFGARRVSIVMQILVENLIITILGGIVGLVLSIVFMLVFYGTFFPTDSASMLVNEMAPSFEMLFTWKAFGIALAFCFVLNLLSATLPAWRASRIQPAVAIAKAR